MQEIPSEKEAQELLDYLRISVFKENVILRAGIKDFLGIQEVLLLAVRLRKLVMLEKVTEADLQACGIKTEKWFLDSDGKRYFSHNDDGEHWLHDGDLTVKINGAIYSAWIKNRLMEREGESCILQKFDENRECDDFCYPDEDSSDALYLNLRLNPGFTDLDDDRANLLFAKEALDELFELHLRNVRTITEYGIPYQTTGDGISALWLSLGFKFRAARVVECKACTKPLLVSGERGTPREYCSDACRKWLQRHPGETRAMRTIKY